MCKSAPPHVIQYVSKLARSHIYNKCHSITHSLVMFHVFTQFSKIYDFLKSYLLPVVTGYTTTYNWQLYTYTHLFAPLQWSRLSYAGMYVPVNHRVINNNLHTLPLIQLLWTLIHIKYYRCTILYCRCVCLCGCDRIKPNTWKLKDKNNNNHNEWRTNT